MPYIPSARRMVWLSSVRQMVNIKSKFRKIKQSYLQIAGIVLLLLLAAFCLWLNNSRSMQAMPSMVGDVYFEGEYRIGDGEWHLIIIDLSKCLRTYTADASGKYVAKHLRLDLFNLSSALEAGKKTYVDIAYVGLCDDYTEILKNDATVSEYLFYNGESVTTNQIQ